TRIAGGSRAAAAGTAGRIAAVADAVDAGARGAGLTTEPAGSAGGVAVPGHADARRAAPRRARRGIADAGAGHTVQTTAARRRIPAPATSVRRTTVGGDGVAGHARR